MTTVTDTNPQPQPSDRRHTAWPRSRGLFDRRDPAPGSGRRLPEARSPGPDQEPGHVRRPGRHGRHPDRGHRPPERVRLVDHRLALPDGDVRQLRRGDGRRAREGAGRHPAQDARRRPRRAASTPTAPRSGSRRRSWRKGDLVVCEAGDLIPSDGEIIEGIASVDESAITGESAPVIRESGGDRSAVTGGTRVLSDRIVVRITAERGQTFLDRMITLVEGANRQKTPNEIALTILLAVLTIVFIPVVVTLQAFGHYSGATVSVVILVVAARVPHPDHHRRPALGHRHRRHGPPRPAQRPRHERAGGRGRRRRADAAAGQDRHDHARQPHGLRLLPGLRAHRAGGGRRRPAGLAGRRDARGSRPSWSWPRSASASASGNCRSGRTSSSRSRRRPGCRASTSMAARSARVRPNRCKPGPSNRAGTPPDGLARDRRAHRPGRFHATRGRRRVRRSSASSS